MRRREFITFLGGAAAAWPLAAQAQQPLDKPTIGFLRANVAVAKDALVAAFVQRLGELGWMEGRTIAIEYRWSEGRRERLPEIVAEFVQRKVDVMVLEGTAATLAAKQRRRSSRLYFQSRATPSVAGWSRAWRGRAATLPVCPSNRQISTASGWKSCARLFPFCVG